MAARIGLVGDIIGDLGLTVQEHEGCPLENVLDENVVALCRSHDELWGNLEAPSAPGLSGLDAYDRQLPHALYAPHHFVTEHSLSALRGMGFTVLNVANNHCCDLLSATDPLTTAQVLQDAGIEPAGMRDSAVMRVIDGQSFVIFGVNNVLMTLETSNIAVRQADYWPRLLKNIAEARRQYDFVVMMVHWGSPFARVAGRDVKDLAKELLKAKVDVVLGSHPHLVWPVFNEDDRAVALSLGNFIHVFGTPPYLENAYMHIKAQRTGIVTLTVTGHKLTTTFVPLVLRHNFDAWFKEVGRERTFRLWGKEDIACWSAGLDTRAVRLRSRLELDGEPVTGTLLRSEIERRYTVPVPPLQEV